jgi:hypothetical protein
MHAYHATYFYLASGMEGRADTADYGLVYAENQDEANAKGEILNGNSTWGLTVKLVKRNVKEGAVTIKRSTSYE